MSILVKNKIFVKKSRNFFPFIFPLHLENFIPIYFLIIIIIEKKTHHKETRAEAYGQKAVQNIHTDIMYNKANERTITENVLLLLFLSLVSSLYKVSHKNNVYTFQKWKTTSFISWQRELVWFYCSCCDLYFY